LSRNDGKCGLSLPDSQMPGSYEHTCVNEAPLSYLFDTIFLNTPAYVAVFSLYVLLYLASDRARFVAGSQFVIDAGLLTR